MKQILLPFQPLTVIKKQHGVKMFPVMELENISNFLLQKVSGALQLIMGLPAFLSKTGCLTLQMKKHCLTGRSGMTHWDLKITTPGITG